MPFFHRENARLLYACLENSADYPESPLLVVSSSDDTVGQTGGKEALMNQVPRERVDCNTL